MGSLRFVMDVPRLVLGGVGESVQNRSRLAYEQVTHTVAPQSVPDLFGLGILTRAHHDRLPIKPVNDRQAHGPEIIVETARIRPPRHSRSTAAATASPPPGACGIREHQRQEGGKRNHRLAPCSASPRGRSRHVDPPFMPAPQYQLFAIGKDVPPGVLTLTRMPQRTFKGRRGAGEGLASRTRKPRSEAGLSVLLDEGGRPTSFPSIPPMPPPGRHRRAVVLLRLLRYRRLGGDQQPRNRRGILQRRSHHTSSGPGSPSSPGHRTPRSAR